MMKITILTIILYFLLLLIQSSHLYFNNDVNLIEQLFDDELKSDTALAALGISAISVSVVHKDRVLFQKGYGQLNPMHASMPVDGDSIYCIGSITKTFTGFTTMQLYERGEVELHNTGVNEYITEFKPIQDRIIGNYDSWNGSPVLVNNQNVTLYHLLTHTAGFDTRYSGIAAMGEQDQLPLSSYLQKNTPPRVRPPGIVSTFNNHDVALLGLITQVKSKMTFGDYLSKNLFDPLNMTSTYYGFSEELDHNSRLASPSIRLSDDSFVTDQEYGKYLNIAPAESIYSSTNDISKWAIMNLNYGYYPENNITVLTPNITRQMFETQFTNRDKLRGMGYIWYENRVNSVSFVSADGNLQPYYSQISLFHEDKVALIILMTSANNNIRSRLRSEFIAKTMHKETYCTKSDELIDPYTGFCFQSFLKSSVIPVTHDYANRWKNYIGCYISSSTAHTDFMKVLMMQNPVFCIEQRGKFLILSNMKYILVEKEVNLFSVNYVNEMDTEALWYDLSNEFILSFLDINGQPLHVNGTSNSGHARYFVIHQETFEYMPFIRSPTMFSAISYSLLVLFIVLLTLTVLGGFGCLVRDSVLVSKYFKEHKYYDVDTYFYEDNLYYDEYGDYVPEYRRLMQRRNKPDASHTVEYVPPTKRMFVLALVVTGITMAGYCITTSLNLASFLGVKHLRREVHVENHRLMMVLPFISAIVAGLTVITVVLTIILRCIVRRELGHLYSIMIILLSAPVMIINVLYIVYISYFNIFPF
jgi:CubicO group peptidase (beta-lactamase class C family)